MRKLPIERVDALLSRLSEHASLYVPTDSPQGAVFAKWSDGTKLTDKLNTAHGIKDFFFPQSEDLMKFRMSGKKIDIVDIRDESEDFIIFGARACDVKAMEVLDNVFLYQEPVDTYYKNRRDHGIIISHACNSPEVTCFCGTFGIDASEPEGDIVAYTSEGWLYLKGISEKGAALVNSISDITEECGDDAVNRQKELIRERLAGLPLAGLDASAFGEGKTEKFFDSTLWDELSEACLGCGTCTFVCPTCQCYDIRDFKTDDGVVRYRCWDSCMYSEFTKMSAGQPRLTQKERFRQRFMHKLVYYPERYGGLYSCVGCGRCLSKCPIRMNIAKVMKKMGGDGNA